VGWTLTLAKGHIKVVLRKFAGYESVSSFANDLSKSENVWVDFFNMRDNPARRDRCLLDYEHSTKRPIASSP
jgi:hypothetical protein